MKKKIFLAIVTILLSCAALLASGVNRLSGEVVDEYGMAIIGASVMELGTTNGAVTDLDGGFEIILSKIPTTIEVSIAGYTTERFRITDLIPKRIVLHEDAGDEID